MPRAQALTSELIDEFFTGHIPTRLAAINGYMEYGAQVIHSGIPAQTASRVVCALGFARATMGRLFLEFLGLTYDSKKKCLVEKNLIDLTGPKAYKEHDVHVEELGGRLVRINELLPGEEETVKTFLHLANKVAHLTYDFRAVDGNDRIQPAVEVINRLLDEHLYKAAGRVRVDDVPIAVITDRRR